MVGPPEQAGLTPQTPPRGTLGPGTSPTGPGPEARAGSGLGVQPALSGASWPPGRHSRFLRPALPCPSLEAPRQPRAQAGGAGTSLHQLASLPVPGMWGGGRRQPHGGSPQIWKPPSTILLA